MAHSRRQALQFLGAAAAATFSPLATKRAEAAKEDPKVEQAIEKGLRWVAKSQSSLGHWTAGGYPTAMTALAGTALVGSGSTTIQGPYAKNIRKAVDYLLGKSRVNGLPSPAPFCKKQCVAAPTLQHSLAALRKEAFEI